MAAQSNDGQPPQASDDLANIARFVQRNAPRVGTLLALLGLVGLIVTFVWLVGDWNSLDRAYDAFVLASMSSGALVGGVLMAKR